MKINERKKERKKEKKQRESRENRTNSHSTGVSDVGLKGLQAFDKYLQISGSSFARSFVLTQNPNPPTSRFPVFRSPPLHPPQTRHRPLGGGGGPIRVR